MKKLACAVAVIGFFMMHPNDKLPFDMIIYIGATGAILLLIATAMLVKLHEKKIKYIKMDFVSIYDYEAHRYITAYNYVGKYKAIRDLEREGYRLYMEEEILWH